MWLTIQGFPIPYRENVNMPQAWHRKKKREYGLYSQFLACVCLVAKLCPTVGIPRTVAHQAPLSMGLASQDYWSGLLFPTPGDLHGSRIEPMSPALQAILYQLSHKGSPKKIDKTKEQPRKITNRKSQIFITTGLFLFHGGNSPHININS